MSESIGKPKDIYETIENISPSKFLMNLAIFIKKLYSILWLDKKGQA